MGSKTSVNDLFKPWFF